MRKSVPRSSRQLDLNRLTIVKRRKLQWYGHVSCSSGLAKAILQGTVKGGRRQGRQRKRWEDNIREWTGLEFGKSQRTVENREKWRKLVARSSVVPQRPSRLRDWWWWRAICFGLITQLELVDDNVWHVVSWCHTLWNSNNVRLRAIQLLCLHGLWSLILYAGC